MLKEMKSHGGVLEEKWHDQTHAFEDQVAWLRRICGTQVISSVITNPLIRVEDVDLDQWASTGEL